MLKTAREIITDLIDKCDVQIDQGRPIGQAFHDLEVALTRAFDWHPIDLADAFDLRAIPAGHRFGPRVIVMVQGKNEKTPAPYVAYWDPDTHQPDGRPVARPKPYWRTRDRTAGWSRRNQPTHFIRPYAPSFDR